MAFSKRVFPLATFVFVLLVAVAGFGQNVAGSVTKAQVKEIAQAKMKDLNCSTIEAAMKMVEGSARSMGLEVKG